MISMLLAALLFAQPQAPATDTAFKQQLASSDAREILEVPRSVLKIEEKGLPVDSLRSAQPGAAPAAKKGGTVEDLTDQGQRGMRLFAFTLEPREKITFKLLVLDSSRMQIGLAPSIKPDDMTGEIQRVNRLQAATRTRKIETQNKTDQPYPLVLRITGSPSVPYALEVLRGN